MSSVYLPIVPFLNEFFAPFSDKPLPVPPAWARVLTAAFTPDKNLKLPYTTVVLSAPKKCMALGERLWLTDGRFVPCESLIGQSFRVWSYDGKGYVAADATAEPNGLDHVIELRLHSGRVIRRTADHRVMGWHGWEYVRNLTPGLKVALPNEVPEPEAPVTSITPDVARFLGYMIGDGGLSGKSTPTFSQNQGPILDDMIAICRGLGYEVTPTGHGVDYRICGSAALCREYDIFGRDSYEHRVPDAIFQSDNATLAQFLGALFAADGWALSRPTSYGWSCQIGFCSMSLGLVEDVQALLARFGIYPRLRCVPAKGRKADVAYRLTIEDRYDVKAFAEKIGIPGKEEALSKAVRAAESRTQRRARHVDQLCPQAWDDLREAIAASGTPMSHIFPNGHPKETWAANRSKFIMWARAIGDQSLLEKVQRPFVWDKIVEVRDLGQQETVAVSVPTYRNYLAHEVSHNSAKTAHSAGIALWFACCMAERADNVIIVANKRDQAKGRAYDVVKRAINNNPILKKEFKVGQSSIEKGDGTKIEPITTEAGGEAGANPGLILYDELWAANGEAAERLFAELTTVLTRRNSIKVITSYAGYLDWSTILYRTYEECMKMPPHPDFLDMLGEDGEPVVRHDPEKRQFCWWETTARMPWQQTEEAKVYMADQERTLRRSDFLRLHKNQWVSNEEGFDMDQWDACVDEDYDPLDLWDAQRTPWAAKLYISAGADASYRKDLSAVVTMFKKDGKFWLGPYDIWAPRKGEDFDFESTIEAYILKLKQRFRLREVYYDPYQLHRSALTLKRKQVRMYEWKQTEPNTKMMGQVLCDMLRDRRLVLPKDPILRHQASSTTLRISPEGIQLKKDKHNLKIDAIIAMAMAAVAAQHLPDVGQPITSQIMVV